MDLYANIDWSTFIDWEKYKRVDFEKAEIKCLGRLKGTRRGGGS